MFCPVIGLITTLLNDMQEEMMIWRIDEKIIVSDFVRPFLSMCQNSLFGIRGTNILASKIARQSACITSLLSNRKHN